MATEFSLPSVLTSLVISQVITDILRDVTQIRGCYKGAEQQLRKMRITSSRFREVCHVRGETSADRLAERMFKGSGMQTMEMKRGLAMEPVAVQGSGMQTMEMKRGWSWSQWLYRSTAH